MAESTSMEVRKPENASCTFSKTGVCNCKKEVNDAVLANKASAQTKETIKK